VSIRRLRLFLDANILHAAAVRDFLLRLAEAGLVDVRWSSPVPEEPDDPSNAAGSPTTRSTA
jgi:hypothetical protein